MGHGRALGGPSPQPLIPFSCQASTKSGRTSTASSPAASLESTRESWRLIVAGGGEGAWEVVRGGGVDDGERAAAGRRGSDVRVCDSCSPSSAPPDCPLVWTPLWSPPPCPLRAHSLWRPPCPSQPPSQRRSLSLSHSRHGPKLGAQKLGSQSKLEPSKGLGPAPHPLLPVAITDHLHPPTCVLF